MFRRARSGWTTRRRGLTVLLAVVVVLVAAVAVLYATGPDRGGSAGIAVAPDTGGAEPFVGGRAGDGAVSSDAAAPAFPEAARAEPAPGADPAQLPAAPLGRDVIRTAQVRVQVDDVRAAGREVRTAVAAAGAFIAEEQADDTGAYLVVRVPAEGLDRLVEAVGALGEVTSRSGQVQDVTEQVVDLDARLASQQASVARIRALLAEATSIGDVVAIEAELARREADLDSLTARRAALADQVALSTLTVDLRTTGDAAPEEEPGPGFRDGLTAGWDGLRAFAGAAAAVIGFVLPFLPLAGALVALAWLVRRRRARAGGRSGPESGGES